MAIILNDNIKINAGKPSESKYLTTGNTAYSSPAAVCAAIPVPERHLGLTVLVESGGTKAEYWFREDVNVLIPKTLDITIPEGDFITGATNIGYFSGTTGLQSLCLSPYSTFNPVNYTCYVGDYLSLYNYYYRDADGIIRVGQPNDGIEKRGYVKTSSNPGEVKSWIWNERVFGSELTGWILIDGDISSQVGTFQNGCVYYSSPAEVFTGATWTIPGSKGTLNIIAVEGSLATGNTLTIGARSFAYSEHNNLHFRTIVSDTPDLIAVWDDNDSLIHLSGVSTSISTTNIGVGAEVSAGMSGTTLQFRRIAGAGCTTVTQSGNTVVIFSTGGTGGDGGLYNLSSPAAISLGGIISGTTLTGKTAFELFEELLVPTLNPTLTPPSSSLSMSPSTTVYEVGCVIGSISFTNTLNPGCISPQYTATCDKRSCGSISHHFTGAQMPGTVTTTSLSSTQMALSYTILCGIQTWDAYSNYCNGVQPKDSKGNDYCSPLVAGSTAQDSVSITGIYPYYYGKITCGIRPPVTQTLIISGCTAKCILPSNGTITVTFGSSPSEWTWVAIPATSPSRVCWYVNALDNGDIAVAPSDKYPDECSITLTSGQGCWAGVNYRVYMSGTVGCIVSPMEFRIS